MCGFVHNDDFQLETTTKKNNDNEWKKKKTHKICSNFKCYKKSIINVNSTNLESEKEKKKNIDFEICDTIDGFNLSDFGLNNSL